MGACSWVTPNIQPAVSCRTTPHLWIAYLVVERSSLMEVMQKLLQQYSMRDEFRCGVEALKGLHSDDIVGTLT